MNGSQTGSRPFGVNDSNPRLLHASAFYPIHKAASPRHRALPCQSCAPTTFPLSEGSRPGGDSWPCLTGTKGNLCQRKMPLAISVALTFPSAVMASYYLLLQTYVLRLEAIMNGILLLFCGSELLLAALTLAAFSRSARSVPEGRAPLPP